MRTAKVLKPFGYFVVLLLALASNANAADWYSVKVTQVVPRTDSGDVVVQFVPGANETRFTELSRGIIFGSDAGTNKIMAVLLTSITLDSEVTVQMDNVPSYTPAQAILGSGLKAASP